MMRTFCMAALAGTMLFAAQGISDTPSGGTPTASLCSGEGCGPCPGPCPIPCASNTACAVETVASR